MKLPAAGRPSGAVVLILLACGVCVPGSSTHAGKQNDGRLGLPPSSFLPLNEVMSREISLGRKLFFDSRLSANGTISCSSCHQPERAFSDGRALAQGINGQVGTRNTPSLLNVGFNSTQFWDGRRTALEDQALDPLTNPIEHGLRDEKTVLGKIRADPQYAETFRQIFSIDRTSIRGTHVAQAIASFERTLVAGDSPFDRFFYGHDGSALSASAQRGLQLFRGQARCSTCHEIGRDFALFTDNSFHTVLSVQRISARLAIVATELDTARKAAAKIDQTILSNKDFAALGRFLVTLNPADIGKFRTPSLRNVAITAPYMHDGSVATLESAVERELYDHGTETGRPLILTPREKSDVVEFLNALTSPVALTAAPDGRASATSGMR